MNYNRELTEKYQLILESNEELSFKRFISKRASGAEKIKRSAEKKGGVAELTAAHFAAKAAPYAEGKPWANKKKNLEYYKSKVDEVYKKLASLDGMSQEDFQRLTGELEVWGELYIQAKEYKD